jgi:site-specific recombinase XerD
LVDAGVRAAELCALDFRDLDPASGALVVRNGKGQKGRYVRIGAAAQKMVRAYLLTRRGLSALDPLFVGRAGARMTPNTLVQLMRRLKVRSGVQELGCHALRRTFALTALRAGMDLHTLRALMGHSNLEILKQYLDLGREDLEAAHERFSPLATITGARTA